MKRILFFTALCATAIFGFCKKDPEPEPTPQELLIGKWKVSKLFFNGTNAVSETATNKVEFELEFKSTGAVIFKSTYTDKTDTPPSTFVNTVNNTYSWDSDKLTLMAVSGPDSVAVTGPAEVTATKLVFTATSGDTDQFVQSIEAEKL